MVNKEKEWRITHLKNLIWSAKNPDSLFNERDIPRFEKELKEIK